MRVNGDQLLVGSDFLQKVGKGDKYVIWHSLFGYPKIVTGATLCLIDLFKRPKSINSLLSEYKINDGIKLLKELVNCYYLIPVGFDERGLLEEKRKKQEGCVLSGNLIKYLELKVSNICNFACDYCINSNVLPRANKFMNFTVAKKGVDAFLTTLRHHRKNKAEISFGGGEPLLNWTLIERVLKYCLKRYGREFSFQFSVNTNGSLLTAEIVKKLKRYGVGIAPSLDGLKTGNDKVRITKSGKGTFDSIINSFNLLGDADCSPGGVTAVVNEKNFPDLNETFIDWAIQRGMKEVHIDVDVINPIKIRPGQVLDKFMKIRNYGKSRGIEVGGFWTRPAENFNNSPLKTYVSFCGAIKGNNMIVDSSGNIYGCGYSSKLLGNLQEFEGFFSFGGNYYCFVRDHFIGLKEGCIGCIIEGQCNGGCNITREFSQKTGNSVKLDWMCDFYRLATKKILIEQVLREH